MASSRRLAPRHQALLLLTGAATLALELLASRVLTPYFGVSLYIWTGILSITLVFLAVGYRVGGLVADLGGAELLEGLALAAPLVAAIAIGVACAVYPVVFPALAGPNLVTGSFVAAAVLLAAPLVALAAVNPLVIGFWRQSDGGGGGGGGRAGRVLFVSTVGSVAGVLLTAFLFIPLLTNYRALLVIGVVLTAGAALGTWRSPIVSRQWKRRLFGLAAVAVALLATLLGGQRRYVNLLAGLGDGTTVATIHAEYTSVFGNLKVVDFAPRDRPTPGMRALLQEGLIQNRTTSDGGVSLSPYTYVLEALTRAVSPASSDVLVLGLGAGVVPRGLERAGFAVTVVEINPDALRAAREFFGFGAADVPVHVTDARTFVRGCRDAYDVAVVDLFLGDSTPEYLLTLEFFRDLGRCLRPGGTVVMNAFFDNTDEAPSRRLLATIGAVFPTLFEFRSAADSREAVSNGFVVGALAAREWLSPSAPAMPDGVSETVRRTLTSGRRVRPDELAGTPAVTDEGNVFGVLHAPAQLMFRARASRALPPHVLMN